MDIEHKKTALDDDAYLYHKTDTISKEDLKKLSRKQKFQYFKDYYLKKLILILLIVIVAVYVLYTTVFRRSDCVLSISVLNSAQLENSEELAVDLRDYLAIENKNDYISTEHFDLDDYQMNMVFVARVAAGACDMIICTYGEFEDLASRGMFAELSDQLPEELMTALSGQILEASVVETDAEGTVLSTEPEAPYGIDLSGSSVFAEYSSDPHPVLCIVENANNPENLLKAIYFLTEK